MMSDSPQCFKCVHVHKDLVFVHMFDMRLCDYVHVYVMSTTCSKISQKLLSHAESAHHPYHLSLL